MKKLLDHIDFPSDLRGLEPDQLPLLAKELRDFIINIVAVKEGHLGASLGVVELTIALHYVFNTPEDLLIWDVGHQAYGHKILTGRKSNFHTNRQLGGLSGFPKRTESEYDVFGTGHSSTSISATLGMALAAKITGDESRDHIAVIGDASIASGMAIEGLNHAGDTDANILVILNDNAIGIDPSVGALKQYLTNVKEGISESDNIFEALKFDYSGPIDGHNLPLLLKELKRLKELKGPRFLHVVTTKGKGLKEAEKDQVTYHAPGKFDPETGIRTSNVNSEEQPPKFQDVFGLSLVELAKQNEKIVGITPAMPTGSSMKFMIETFPKRAFDVGIAEQHAVTLAGGMATQGLVPFCNIYSTFLQRGYDQLIHDIALQSLPVIFCLDRAGIVGQDGATHHGVFDLAYLKCIPNMIIAAPRNEMELRNLMYTAQLGLDKPIAIRYPRGRGQTIKWRTDFHRIEIGKGEELKKGSSVAVLTLGTMSHHAALAIQMIENNEAIGHYDMRYLKPLDQALLHYIFQNYSKILTLEDGVLMGGFGESVSSFSVTNGYCNKVINLGVPDEFVEHGTLEELLNNLGLDADGIYKVLCELI